MHYILIHNSEKKLVEWQYSIIQYLNAGDTMVAILCYSKEDSGDNTGFLLAKNKENLIKILKEETSSLDEKIVIFKANLFYEKSVKSIIIDILHIYTFEVSNFFVQEEQLSSSNLHVSSFAPCRCFKKIHEIFKNT